MIVSAWVSLAYDVAPCVTDAPSLCPNRTRLAVLTWTERSNLVSFGCEIGANVRFTFRSWAGHLEVCFEKLETNRALPEGERACSGASSERRAAHGGHVERDRVGSVDVSAC